MVELIASINWQSGKLLPLRKKCPYSELFWSECGKIRTRITPNTDTFYVVYLGWRIIIDFQVPFTCNDEGPSDRRFKCFLNTRKKMLEKLATMSSMLYETLLLVN